MKIKMRNIIIFIVVITLFGAVNTASAETDSTGDLWHWKVTNVSGEWELYSEDSKDYLDITNIEYSIEGSDATLTMTLAEDIQDSTLIQYHMHLVTGSDYYGVVYTNSVGIVSGTGSSLSGYYEFLTSPVSGNTLTATFTLNDPSLTYELRGYAQELSSIGDETAEWWGDWAPDAYFNAYTGYTEEDDTEEDDTEEDDTEEEDTEEDDTEDDETEDDEKEDDGTTETGDGEDSGSTPGFELISIIAAIGVAYIILRKKK